MLLYEETNGPSESGVREGSRDSWEGAKFLYIHHSRAGRAAKR